MTIDELVQFARTQDIDKLQMKYNRSMFCYLEYKGERIRFWIFANAFETTIDGDLYRVTIKDGITIDRLSINGEYID